MRIKSGTPLGQFLVERPLSNHGTTAQVVLAHDGQQQVALKVVRKQQPVYQDHLRREVETLRRLDHPGVVRLCPVLGDDIYAARAETLRGQPWYFAMEYLQPLDIHSYSLAQRLELFRGLVESVAYLHEQGIAHGDLKPDHILLRCGKPVLIDFGAACPVSEPPAEPTASLPYAAPELLRTLYDGGSPADLHPAALDTWALGAILYEWTTGRQLVAGFMRRAVVRNTINGRFDVGKAPEVVRPLLDMMLRMRPEDRGTVKDVQNSKTYAELPRDRAAEKRVE